MSKSVVEAGCYDGAKGQLISWADDASSDVGGVCSLAEAALAAVCSGVVSWGQGVERIGTLSTECDGESVFRNRLMARSLAVIEVFMEQGCCRWMMQRCWS